MRHPEAATRTRALFTTLGCEVIERNPAEHDRIMARTHALTFFIARALTDMGVGEDLSLAPPSFRRLSETLAAVHGDAEHLFAAIERENPYAAAARSELLEHLASIHWSLESGDATEVATADDTLAVI